MDGAQERGPGRWLGPLTLSWLRAASPTDVAARVRRAYIWGCGRVSVPLAQLCRLPLGGPVLSKIFVF